MEMAMRYAVAFLVGVVMGAMAAGPQVRGVVARGKVLKVTGRRRGRRQCVRAVRRHAAMAGVLGTLMLLPTVQGLLHGAAGLLQVPPAIVACLGIAVAGWKSFLWGKRTTSWQGCSGARQSYAVRGGAEKQEQRQECKLERGEEQFEGTGLCNAGNTCYMNGGGEQQSAADFAMSLCSKVEDTVKGCFGMQVLRQQRHKCSVDTCRSYNVAHSTEMTEAWTVLLVENTQRSRATAQVLIQRTFQGQLLPQALRCDACGGQKDVLQESRPLSAPEVLIVSFPRNGNGHVDPHTGRWCKNEREVDCTGPVEINGTLYRFVALVEHIALDCGDAEQGHFVTWTMEGGSWLRYDDTVVTRISALPKKVAKSVVLAVYETCVVTSFATEQAATGSVADMTPTDPAANAEENAAGSIAPATTELASTVLDSQAGEALQSTAGVDAKAESLGLQTLPFAETADGTLEFERDVVAALSIFQAGAVIAGFEADEFGGKQAVELQYPLWRTSFYPILVLMEAWSRSTGMPTVFYYDAFCALLMGLLHKEICVDVAGYPCRSRYWAIGTARPGSGKSPAVDPMVECLRSVLQENLHLAAGCGWDKFHLLGPGTHCAAVDKLKVTDGYATLIAGEGGPLLCPSYPQNGTWNQSTHINFSRFLDSATAIDRKAKKESAEDKVVPVKGVPLQKTNVTFALLQQLSVWQNWWVASEVRSQIGLPQRCMFSFGALRDPGPPRLQGFEKQVVMPILRRIFQSVLKSIGCKAPMAIDAPAREWKLTPALKEVFHAYRLTCRDVTKRTFFGETLATGLHKAPYWVSTVALFGTLMEELTKTTLPTWSGQLSAEGLKMATLCFQGVEAMGELLRTLVGSGWRAEWTRRCGPPFRNLPAPLWKEGPYEEVMALLAERGLGQVRGQCFDNGQELVFVKFAYSVLPKEAKDSLKEMGVPSWSFGRNFAYQPQAALQREDDWASRFAWEEEKTFVTWPARSADALFNSKSLRSAGRSPARDFWEHREPRLCGNRNYRQVYIRTGEAGGTDVDGVTTFWVLQSRLQGGVMPAEAVVTPQVAEMVANLIASEGPQLEKWLCKAGIAKDGELELKALQKYMQQYCAVLEGCTRPVSQGGRGGWGNAVKQQGERLPAKEHFSEGFGAAVEDFGAAVEDFDAEALPETGWRDYARTVVHDAAQRLCEDAACSSCRHLARCWQGCMSPGSSPAVRPQVCHQVAEVNVSRETSQRSGTRITELPPPESDPNSDASPVSPQSPQEDADAEDMLRRSQWLRVGPLRHEAGGAAGAFGGPCPGRARQHRSPLIPLAAGTLAELGSLCLRSRRPVRKETAGQSHLPSEAQHLDAGAPR
ncbi:unnamed protein product, partial [Effrenium voratum]